MPVLGPAVCQESRRGRQEEKRCERNGGRMERERETEGERGNRRMKGGVEAVVVMTVIGSTSVDAGISPPP